MKKHNLYEIFKKLNIYLQFRGYMFNLESLVYLYRTAQKQKTYYYNDPLILKITSRQVRKSILIMQYETSYSALKPGTNPTNWGG